MANPNFCRPIDDGARIVYAPVVIAPNPNPPTEAEYNAAGWYRKAIVPPMPPEGKIVGKTTYKVEGNVVVAEYEYEDAPPPPPRTFSKLRIVAALISAGVWEQVKGIIEGAGLYDLFLAAQDFSEGNEFFDNGKTVLQQQLGWTDEQVEDVLKSAEVNP